MTAPERRALLLQEEATTAVAFLLGDAPPDATPREQAEAVADLLRQMAPPVLAAYLRGRVMKDGVTRSLDTLAGPGTETFAVYCARGPWSRSLDRMEPVQ